MMRVAAATSLSTSERGIWTQETVRPAAWRVGTIFAQEEPSAQAPWTRTTFFTAGIVGFVGIEIGAIEVDEIEIGAIEIDAVQVQLMRRGSSYAVQGKKLHAVVSRRPTSRSRGG